MENRGKIKGWQAILTNIQEQMQEWKGVDLSWKEQQISSFNSTSQHNNPSYNNQRNSGSAASDGAMKDEDRALLAGNQGRNLALKMDDAYKQLSVKMDIILSGLKRLNQFVATAVDYRKTVADSINQSAFPYTHVKEPKALITALLRPKKQEDDAAVKKEE